MQTTESYFGGNELAISTFNNKYALPKRDRLEYPEEAVSRVIRHLLPFEKNRNIGKIWLETWMKGYWRFGGSIFTVGNIKHPKQSTANCTATTIEEDTLESIFKTAYEIAKCAAYRQGVGVDISALRPRGAKLNNSAKVSDGSIHWLDFISQLANFIGQSGRRPALLGSLNINHPDILEFISAKDDLKRLTNMNISVQIPDSFMLAAMKDRTVALKFGGETYRTINAMELLKKIADHAYNFGEPGIQFISLMKKHSMQEAVGYPIVSSNACCIPGYTQIFTDTGIQTVQELLHSKKFTVLTDQGNAVVDEVLPQDKKLVYRITTKEGVELDATYDHKIKKYTGEMCEAQQLHENDKLAIPTNNEKISHSEDFDIGVFIGYLVGNGSYNSKRHLHIYIPNNDTATLKWMATFISKYIPNENLHMYKKHGCTQICISNAIFRRTVQKWGLDIDTVGVNKHAPEIVLKNKTKMAGFLRGYFTADGSVIYGNGPSIQAGSIALQLLKEIQQMLLYFGIKSSIYKNRRGGKTTTMLPDTNRCLKEYTVAEMHRLDITSAYVLDFANSIGLVENSPKHIKLDGVKSRFTRLQKKRAYLRVKSVQPIGMLPVYDLINSTTGTFSANGIIVSNSEKPLPRNGVCNLCSINLGAMPKDNWEKHLNELVPPIVRFMDDVTSYELAENKSPLPSQRATIEALREIGIGVTNVHEWLLKHNTAYGSRKGNKLLEEVISYISKLVWAESEKLAAVRGSFPAFDKKALQNSQFYNHMCKELWEPHGLRFAANMSIAPAGSISLILPHYISQGIEPAIGFAYWRKTRVENSNYDYYFVLTDIIKQALLDVIDNDYEYNFINDLGYSTLDNTGEVGTVAKKIISKYGLDKIFASAHDVPIENKLDLLWRIQPWVDAGISTTFNLPKDYPQYTLPKFICDAWQKGIKCLSIYRTGSRDDILTFDPPKQSSTKEDGARPLDITPTFAPKRPESLPCTVHKVVVKGMKYVVLVGLMNGKPYEVFAGKIDNIDIPTTATEGRIVKRKSGVYDLHIEMDRINKVIPDLAHTFMNIEHGALTRSISRELRHGIPIYFIVDGLKKAEGDITDFSKVLARVLSKYNGHIPEFAVKSHTCPNCGNPLTVEGGCEHCVVCGFSKCG